MVCRYYGNMVFLDFLGNFIGICCCERFRWRRVIVFFLLEIEKIVKIGSYVLKIRILKENVVLLM